MYVECTEINDAVAAVGGKDAAGTVDIDPEFGFLFASGCVFVRLRVDVGIDAKSGLWGFARLLREADEIFQLGLRFYIKESNPGIALR